MHDFTAPPSQGPLHVIVQLLLLLVTAVGSVPVSQISYKIQLYAIFRVWLLEELLDQVDVGHDHSAATVSLQTKLIHGIAVDSVSISLHL